MSRVRGSTANLRGFGRRLLSVGAGVAIDVARKAAPAISGLARASFDSGRTAYDGARPLGVNGNALSLVQTGRARTALAFVSDGGTRIRALLTARYVRYLIGKYKILPAGRSAMPARWKSSLDNLAATVIGAALGVEPSQLKRTA